MYFDARLRQSLVILFGVAILLYSLLAYAVATSASRDEQKLAAAQRVLEAEQAILAVRGPDTDASESQPTDPLQAALIGPYSSAITTDLGALAAKVTATNPNFGAAIISLLRGAHVGPGDVVAVSYTGSFPVLDIATVIAIETLGAEPIIISSVGASNWGATAPDFTILDVEAVLHAQGIVYHRSVAASVGGSFNRGKMSARGVSLASAAIERNGLPRLEQTSLTRSVNEHLRLYRDHAAGRPIKAFVNVGGGQVSTGGRAAAARLLPGFVAPQDTSETIGRGLLSRMQQAGVPTIHLDNVTALAAQYQLPIAPVQTPPVGEGGPYLDWPFLQTLAWLTVISMALAVAWVRLVVLRPRREHELDAYFGTFRLQWGWLTRRWTQARPRSDTA